MSKKTNPNIVSDGSAVPIFYVDQPAGLALGPHVCRLTFGVEEEDGSEYPRPVVAIAIPTVSLLLMVNDLVHTLNSPEFKKGVANSLAESARKLAEGVTAVPSASLVQSPKSRKSRALPPKEV